MDKPLFRKVDAVLVRVSDIEQGLAFYRDALGMELLWRKENEAAVRLGDAELVMSTEHDTETDILVDSVQEAIATIERAGGFTIVAPFDIDVGLAAVIRDPFGNHLTLIELSKGQYQTDADGNVTGVA